MRIEVTPASPTTSALSTIAGFLPRVAGGLVLRRSESKLPQADNKTHTEVENPVQ